MTQPSRRVRRPRWSRWVALAAGLVGLAVVLQWPVTTREGVNWQVRTRMVPLYLKLARFIVRDLEYRHVVHEETRGLRDDDAQAVRLYQWVREHIHSGTPRELPVVDDHVWHIMIRGYGESDQLADVLATLCAYAGLPAQAVAIGSAEHGGIHSVTMVRLHDRWCFLDPFYGVVVRDADGHFLSREEIVAHPELVEQAAPGLLVRGVPYARRYAAPLPDLAGDRELRPYRQMVVWRPWLELRRRLGDAVTRMLRDLHPQHALTTSTGPR